MKCVVGTAEEMDKLETEINRTMGVDKIVQVQIGIASEAPPPELTFSAPEEVNGEWVISVADVPKYAECIVAAAVSVEEKDVDVATLQTERIKVYEAEAAIEQALLDDAVAVVTAQASLADVKDTGLGK